ncbi:MAG TPA: AraC family transcriptional regulator [Bryobacteraceae bacterium]|jgi:AraC family transcriptional regulator|nr:AraC family transcriptional regulator [Bryobacteraceae bacterium]
MKPSTEQDYHERIVRTLVFIQQHLDESLELEHVASVAAFSNFHFHRIFRGLVGESLKEHVRRLRLERAAQRLKRDDEPVTEVALDAGFETHEAFTRAFKTMFGVSPSGYRAAHKPAPEAASGTHFDDASGYHPPDYGDPLPVEMKEMPPMQVVFLRHVGPYSEVGATWGRLMSWAGSRGLLGPQMMLIGIVHDDPDVTPTGKLRYDAAVRVRPGVRPEGEFGVLELPGGKYAMAMHKGPYEALGSTYQRLYGGWLPKSGYELRDSPAFEQYLNSPQNSRPEDLVTLIHVPVE